MSDAAPVLLLGFNRPGKMRQLIASLRASSPETVLLAVDGPRSSHPADHALVKQVQDCAALIDWTQNVDVLFRERNLGLQSAVTEAVSWAVSRYGRAIVLEDDCVPGPLLIPFMNHALEKYVNQESIAHVNGYNLVPRSQMSFGRRDIRLTRYIESYAWATWERGWKEYDASMDWGLNCALEELASVVGSRTAALRWRINFRDALSERIDTWAYRWMATIWSHGWSAVAPNSNLCAYDGHNGGTHTLRRPRWTELPIQVAGVPDEWFDRQPEADTASDRWTGRTVFRENVAGLVEGVVASVAMGLRGRYWN